jgi:hypothetical protein
MHRASFALLFALIYVSQSPAFAESVINGGFERPQITSGEYLNVSPGAEPADFGWIVTSGNVDIVLGGRSYIAAFEGSQFLDLDGSTAGAVQQAFATTSGTLYDLSFAYANNSNNGTSTASALLRLFNTSDEADLIGPVTLTHSTSSLANPDWTIFSLQFVATGDGTTLSFASNSPSGSVGGITIDAVSVNLASVVVPEPAGSVLAAECCGLTALAAVAGGLSGKRRPPGAAG